MKETIGAILALLQELLKDIKATGFLVVLGLLVGSLYVVYIQVTEKNDISESCERELRECQRQRILELQQAQDKIIRATFSLDSISRIRLNRRK